MKDFIEWLESEKEKAKATLNECDWEHTQESSACYMTMLKVYNKAKEYEAKTKSVL